MNKAHNLSMTSIEVLEGLSYAWQQKTAGVLVAGDEIWSENWFNWRRSRFRN